MHQLVIEHGHEYLLLEIGVCLNNETGRQPILHAKLSP
jgi:hypothetical protein